ncbi:MAG: site-specific DNA-methyltransferase [Armatimonadetes bacterium]|nr:site-specific DNA-methyltransferase [Armatimonadota bacterium]
MTKEQKFYNALKDIFVGAKVEGESGYINLMRIKSRYYEQGVFPKLQKDIENALQPLPDDFREELFDKLYTFFSRYFSESGSIYFRYTPLHQNVYEKIYTNDKDVMLFWKTHMLYYVKTDRLYRNLEIELDGTRFFFDVSTLEHKRANEKREIIYEFKAKRNDGTLVFTVTYSENGRKTKIEEILKNLQKTGAQISVEVLEKAFRVFERQSEVDYFINKNAKAFLEEQFDLWLYQYLFSGKNIWTEQRIRELQTLKDIAFKIIAFISQFEDELAKIWNKPKFVLNSNYVITLDRIAERNLNLVERLLNHINFMAQLEEWQQLGMVDDDFKQNEVVLNNLIGKYLNEKYRYLPIDTRYFKDLELEILELFDNLDETLDGWVIKSENYQALNTLLPKFRKKVKVIYIDPPYNTGGDEFLYNDKYQHSSWLSMMADRLALAKELLTMDGGLFVSIDYNEDARLRLILEDLFGAEQYRNTIITARVKKSIMERERVRSLNWGTGYLMLFAASEKTLIVPPLLPQKSQKKEKWHAFDAPGIRPTMEYELFGIKPPPGRHWMYSQDRAFQMIENGELKRNPKTGRIEYKVPDSEGILLDTNWTDVLESDSKWDFSTEKNVTFLQRAFNMLANHNDYILDFFAGSGTTAHAVINLNQQDGGKRKYILVEMADCFETVLLPRIKKVIFCTKWQNGKPGSAKGISHMLKYYQLEQYEDALRKAKYEDADLFDNPYEDPYHQYIFLRDLKMLEALAVNLEQNQVKVDLSRIYENIDIAETLSNLTGKWIKRITSKIVEFADGETINLQNLDYRLIKPLIWWRG